MTSTPALFGTRESDIGQSDEVKTLQLLSNPEGTNCGQSLQSRCVEQLGEAIGTLPGIFGTVHSDWSDHCLAVTRQQPLFIRTVGTVGF